MAREAGWKDLRDYDSEMRHDFFMGNTDSLKAFEALVRADERNSWPAEMEAMERQVNILTDALAAEREACAKLCETYNKRQCYNDEDMAVAKECAKAIRARGNT
jgi:hypothetical protein